MPNPTPRLIFVESYYQPLRGWKPWLSRSLVWTSDPSTNAGASCHCANSRLSCWLYRRSFSIVFYTQVLFFYSCVIRKTYIPPFNSIEKRLRNLNSNEEMTEGSKNERNTIFIKEHSVCGQGHSSNLFCRVLGTRISCLNSEKLSHGQSPQGIVKRVQFPLLRTRIAKLEHSFVYSARKE